MTLRLPDSGAPILPDGRRSAPSAERNAAAILAVLARHAPAEGVALELASGTGQHVVALARAHPGLDWQPSDLSPDSLRSIIAWRAALPSPNLRAPVRLDACAPGWAAGHSGLALILAVNLLHLIPAAGAAVLIAEAASALRPGGVLAIYGPFLRDGLATSPGDAAFHASLQAQDPVLGYKDLPWVTDRFVASGLDPDPPEPMPANNLMLIARRPG